MVVFSPDSSDEDSLNLIKAKLRKRAHHAVEQDDTTATKTNDDDSSVDEPLADNDKENAALEGSSSQEDILIHRNKETALKDDDWNDDDSIPDDALEAAMLAAQTVQAKWRGSSETGVAPSILQPSSNPPSSSSCRGTRVPSPTKCSLPQDQLHEKSSPKAPSRPSASNESENDDERSSSGDSSSSSDSSETASIPHVPEQIVLRGTDKEVASSKSTSPVISCPCPTPPKECVDSEQDVTPYASPEQSVNSQKDSSSKPPLTSNLQDPEEDETTKKHDTPVPMDDPFCICEYASEDEWSFSELENKAKPPPEQTDELDPFGLAITDADTWATNHCGAATEQDNAATHGNHASTNASNADQQPNARTSEEETEPLAAPPVSSDRESEIDPSLYAPKPPVVFEPPIVHEFNLRTRPLSRRSTVSIHTVFHSPITRLWYSKFDSFNQMQSEMSNMLANSDDNVVVSAPTGAGKTAVFEMAMARFFSTDLSMNGTNQISKKRKIVYISPSKALCEERYDDWSRRLQGMNLGIQLAVITGDGDPAESFHDLASSQFILTTPEKWDSLTRRWTEKFFLFASVKLFLIDEVHMIADGSRGCCLEAIIMRMKTIQKAAQNVSVSQAELVSSSYASTSPEAVNSVCRMVAVSATLPNISEIAMFLEANEAHSFDESYRPVPLTTHVVSTGRVGKNEFLFGKNLCESVPSIVLRFSDQKPTIVFCHSKNDTEKLADLLARSNQIGSNANGMSNIASQTRLRKLQMAMMRGMAYHHAGLDVSDRRIVEKAFMEGKIKVLCATSTLAMGVNLPAHLVVIMGTRAWRGKSGYQDLEQASLLQMIGRAGRPGFDTTGTAVILTDLDSKHKFEALAANGLSPAMSQCVGEKLVETLNTEISQRVVTSSETASNWFMNTLYFIQDTKNAQSAEEIESRITEQCNAALSQLKAIGAVASSPSQDIFPLSAGHTMSSNLVGLDAFKAITSIPSHASLCQVLRALSNIEDLQRPLRRSEKKPLNAAQKCVKYHLEGPPSQVRVKDNWEKAFVLLQVHISRLQLDCNNPTLDFTLRSEMTSMVDFASRMLAAVEEYSHKGSKNGHIVFQSLRLRRSLALNLWGPQDGVLSQIQGISKECVGKLRMNGITSFDDVVAKTAGQIETSASRQPPFGSDLQTACQSLLESALKVEVKLSTSPGCTTPHDVVCSLTPRVAHVRSARSSKAIDVKYSLIVYTDQPGGCLLYRDNISESGDHRVLVPPKFGKLSVRLVASICGLDDAMELEGNIPVASSKPALSSSITDERNKSNRIRNTGVKRKGSTQTTLVKKPRNAKPNTSRKSALFESQQSTAPEDQIGNNNDATARRSTAAKLSKPAVASTITPSPKSYSPMMSPYSAPGAGELVAGKRTEIPQWRSRSAPRDLSGNASQPNRRTFKTTHSPMPSKNRTTVSSTLQSSYSDRIAVGSSPCSALQASGWKRARSQQQKQQQRAFVHKKDNPFTLYSHDPNNSESFLDELSTQNRSQDARSIIPPNAMRNTGSYGFQSRISERPTWNRSNAARRQKRMFQSSHLNRTVTSPYRQSNEHQPPPRGFENYGHSGSSHQMPFVPTQPHSSYHSSTGRFPAKSPHGTSNHFSPAHTRNGGLAYQMHGRHPNLGHPSYDQFSPPQTPLNHYPSTVHQQNAYPEPLRERTRPLFHREPPQDSYATPLYQDSYESHNPFGEALPDPAYVTQAPYSRPYGVRDPRLDYHHEEMIRGEQFVQRPSADPAHQDYQRNSFESQYNFPLSSRHHNFQIQDPMPAPTHGVNDDDLAKAFL